MLGTWGYIIWGLLSAKLVGYAVWLWRQNYRLGVFGVFFVILLALAFLLFGTLYHGRLP